MCQPEVPEGATPLQTPPGFAGVGFGVGLGVLQSVYEGFLDKPNSAAPPITAGPQGGGSPK